MTCQDLPLEVLTLVAQSYLETCPDAKNTAHRLYPSDKCEHMASFSLVCKRWMLAMRPFRYEKLKLVVGGAAACITSRYSQHVQHLNVDDSVDKLRHVRSLGVFIEGSELHEDEEPVDVATTFHKLVDNIGSLRTLELNFLGSGWKGYRLDGVFEAFAKIPKLQDLSLATKYVDSKERDLLTPTLKIVERARPHRMHIIGGPEGTDGLVLKDHHLSRLALVQNLVLCTVKIEVTTERALAVSHVEELMIIDRGVCLEEVIKLMRCFGSSLKRCLVEFSFDESTCIAPLDDLTMLRDARFAAYNAKDGELDALGAIDMILGLLANTKLQTPLIVCPAAQLVPVIKQLASWFRSHPSSFAHLAGIRLCPPEDAPKSCPFDANNEPAWLELCEVADECCFVVQAYDTMRASAIEPDQ